MLTHGFTSRLVWTARIFWPVGLQSYSLASYPAEYKHDDGFYALCLLFVPALVLRFYIMCEEKKLQEYQSDPLRKISALQTKVELAGNFSIKQNLAENLAYREVASWKMFLVNK